MYAHLCKHACICLWHKMPYLQYIRGTAYLSIYVIIYTCTCQVHTHVGSCAYLSLMSNTISELMCIFNGDHVSGDLPSPVVQWFCYLRILHLLRISFYISESRRVPGCNSIGDLSLKIVCRTHKFAVGTHWYWKHRVPGLISPKL